MRVSRVVTADVLQSGEAGDGVVVGITNGNVPQVVEQIGDSSLLETIRFRCQG